jgi:hypothetical protein
MCGVARRLDCDAAEIEPAGQSPMRGEIIERGQNEPAEVAENVSHVARVAVPDLICR